MHRQSKQYNHFPGKTKKKGIIIIVKIFICTVRCSTIQYCRVNLQAGVLPLLFSLPFQHLKTGTPFFLPFTAFPKISFSFFSFFSVLYDRLFRGGEKEKDCPSSLSKRALFNIRLEQFSNIFKNPHCFPGGVKEVVER